MEESKLILGLDIGIASVGWAVINRDNNDIVESGVRLFESADVSKNVDRRGFRGVRRNKRRQKHRLLRVQYLMEKNGINKPYGIDINPLIARNKGLKEELTVDELYAALFNLAKHRGISYLEDLEVNEKEQGGLSLNALELEKSYPCQIQLKRFNEFNQFRGTLIEEDVTYINTFTTSAYVKEAKAILEKQKEYHNNITDKFIEEYIFLLKQKREYYEGPGNEKNRTNYGIYKTSGITEKNLFNELRGKCSVYNGKEAIYNGVRGKESELRASGASYTAQYFNLLNDLCNIKVGNEKLNKEQKKEVIEFIKKQKKKTKITKALTKLYGIDEKEVSGYRIDKKSNEENHSFEIYRKMVKDLPELNITEMNEDTLDVIADILTLNTEIASMLDFFNDKDADYYQKIEMLSQDDINLLINFRLKNTTLFNKWNSFSYRLLKQIIPEMLETGDEQHTTLTKMKIKEYLDEKQSKIDEEELVDEIYNPVVTRSIRQTIKIVNTLLKKYQFSDIVIEMPRENNDKERKDKINKLQKDNEEIFKKALLRAGVDEEQLDFKNHNNLKMKLKLYYRQDGKCLYSGNEINVSSLINNDSSYEIDHIIPISISFDDSQANKVLVEANQNRKKSNMTPYMYLSNNGSSWNYATYKAYVLDLEKKNLISRKQKDLLLFEQEITKQEVVKGFITRNLNDTRYASRVVLNSLQRFFNNNDSNTKVKVINGAFTNQFRKALIKYDKNRDLDYSHHAVDAMICCYSIISLNKYQDTMVNLDTGEIVNIEEFNNIDKREGKDVYITYDNWLIRERIVSFKPEIKYSHKVDRKVNRAISDQTIYGTREIDGQVYVVNKIKDIYDDKEYEKFYKKITGNEKDENLYQENKFLMKRYNEKTWDILMKIIKMYPDHKNPFKKYKEEFGPIKKYSKKDNGPELKELKYLDHKLGSRIEITHKYDNTKNLVVLESLKPYRSDVYYDKVEKRYNIVPIRYSDFKFEKGEYILPNERYITLLKEEKLINEQETLEDLENRHEFKFSLYKNDLIEIGDDEKTEFYLFLAKSYSEKNRFEVKGINEKFSSRTPKTVTKQITIFKKYNVDILGNIYSIESERLILKFKLDNKMIK